MQDGALAAEKDGKSYTEQLIKMPSTGVAAAVTKSEGGKRG